MWGGTEPVGEVWYTLGSSWTECEQGAIKALLQPTEYANPSELIANPENYDVTANGDALIYWAESIVDGAAFVNSLENPTFGIFVIDNDESHFAEVDAPCDYPSTDSVEVTVTKK